MKLWVLSDLHIEQSVWELPYTRPDYDVLIAAGDIHQASAGVDWLADRAGGHPVIYVPGNHEWYSTAISEELPRARQLAADRDIRLLVDGEAIIGDVRFLGATLWTDYELYDPIAGRAMDLARVRLNDHRLIQTRPGVLFDPEDARALHTTSRSWLREALATKPAGVRKTVVVTHHLPHRRSIDSQYQGEPLNAAFASDLSELVERGGVDVWIHGHSHSSCDYIAGACRVVANPKGYGPRRPGGAIENPAFDPQLIVEV